MIEDASVALTQPGIPRPRSGRRRHIPTERSATHGWATRLRDWCESKRGVLGPELGVDEPA